jgi:hypothetical protein
VNVENYAIRIVGCVLMLLKKECDVLVSTLGLLFSVVKLLLLLLAQIKHFLNS